MIRSELINEKYGFDTANETQTICESDTNDKVLEMKRLEEFSDEFLQRHNNGEIWGVYYENSDLVAQLIDGRIVRNILFTER